MQVGGHAGEVFERPLRKIVINITMSKSKETQCKNLHIRMCTFASASHLSTFPPDVERGA